MYTFTTPKLQPLVTKHEGKNLIQVCVTPTYIHRDKTDTFPLQACLNAPSPSDSNGIEGEPPVGESPEEPNHAQVPGTYTLTFPYTRDMMKPLSLPTRTNIYQPCVKANPPQCPPATACRPKITWPTRTTCNSRVEACPSNKASPHKEWASILSLPKRGWPVNIPRTTEAMHTGDCDF